MKFHRAYRVGIPLAAGAALIASPAFATFGVPIPEPGGMAIFAVAIAVAAVAIRVSRRR
jgi:hypothetical protein